MLYLIASYIMIMAETSRLPLVAGWDDVLPAWFTKLHPRYRTPVRSLTVIVGLSALASVLASVGAGREEAFQVLQNSNQICFGVYYCAMFGVPLAMAFRRTEKTPGFWILVSAVLGLIVTVAEVILANFPIVEVNSTLGFAVKVLLTAVGLNLVGFWIYWRGTRKPEVLAI